MTSFLAAAQAASPVLLVVYGFMALGFLIERLFGDKLDDPVSAYHNPNVQMREGV